MGIEGNGKLWGRKGKSYGEIKPEMFSKFSRALGTLLSTREGKALEMISNNAVRCLFDINEANINDLSKDPDLAFDLSKPMSQFTSEERKKVGDFILKGINEAYVDPAAYKLLQNHFLSYAEEKQKQIVTGEEIRTRMIKRILDGQEKWPNSDMTLLARQTHSRRSDVEEVLGAWTYDGEKKIVPKSANPPETSSQS